MAGSFYASIGIFCRRLAAGVVLLYTSIALGLGGSPVARPFFFGSVLVLFSLLLIAWRLRPVRKWSRRVEWTAFLLAALLTLGEAALRLTSNVVADNALATVRLIPGLDYGGGLRGNRLGYPGRDWTTDKPPGVFRIAVLGDSHLVGPVVPFADNFLTLLEQSLPQSEVLNFGVSGTGPREYRQILRQDVWPFRPDLVLVCVFVTNDVTDQLPTPRHFDPRQHALYCLLTGGRPKPIDSTPELAAAAFAERLRAGTLAGESFCEVEAQRLAVCLDPEPPGLDKKWRRCLDDLDGLLADCRGHQAPAVFVLIPDQGQADPQARQDVFRSGVLDPARFDLDRPQRRFMAFCDERGVPCLDLLPAFCDRAGLYQPRNTHWNIAGHHRAAERLAAWLSCRARP